MRPMKRRPDYGLIVPHWIPAPPEPVRRIRVRRWSGGRILSVAVRAGVGALCGATVVAALALVAAILLG